MSAWFPLQWPYDREEVKELKRLKCPRAIPWDVIAPFEDRALKNHDQTLKRLAERSGLSPHEALAVLTDQPWKDVCALDNEEVVQALHEILESHSKAGK